VVGVVKIGVLQCRLSKDMTALSHAYILSRLIEPRILHTGYDIVQLSYHAMEAITGECLSQHTVPAHQTQAELNRLTVSLRRL
jgi:hypothetical protein